MSYLESHYVPTPFKGQLVYDNLGKIKIKYPYGQVDLVEPQTKSILQMIKPWDVKCLFEVDFMILPVFNSREHTGYIIVPNNIFESCPSAEE